MDKIPGSSDITTPLLPTMLDGVNSLLPMPPYQVTAVSNLALERLRAQKDSRPNTPMPQLMRSSGHVLPG